MDRQITQRELRNERGGIMRELDQGASFVVTRAGVPVAHLIPMHHRMFVRAEVEPMAIRGVLPINATAFRGDLDALADQDATPRG